MSEFKTESLVRCSEEKKKYEYEDILAMLGGTEYFMEEQIQYIFHKLNGNEEIAAEYLNICLDYSSKMQHKLNRMKTLEEIEIDSLVDASLNNVMTYEQ